MSQLARYDAQDGVATITLDDATVNCYTYEMNRQVDECILKARFDTNVHVIVFRGAGEKFFSAGADLKLFADGDPETARKMAVYFGEAFEALADFRGVSIAAVNGWATRASASRSKLSSGIAPMS